MTLRSFIRDCWYVVAWDHEVPDVGLFSRRVLGEPVLLYRKADRGIVALEDRCCHRSAPLSKGRLEGDCVRCGYHGLKFGPDGQCVEAPGLDRIPDGTFVRRYPVVVRNRWVFVWMGAPERADEALLPDNFSCQHPEWWHLPGYLHYDVNWQLICDNLLDFSHLTWVHEATLGGSTAIAHARPTIEPVPRGLKVARRVPNVPPPPFYAGIRRFDGPIDRWFVYDFVLPGTLLMHSGGKPTGRADDDLSDAVQLHSCQTLTPETETTTHYFFMQAYRAPQEDPAMSARILASLVSAFEEDRAMITAQQRNIAMSPDAPMKTLALDGALVRFRRIVDEARAAEAQAPR